MAALVVTERQGRVLVATLARAPVNALDDPLIAALDAVLEQAIDDDEVAVLHLRSEQRAFSAGADLSLIESCFATPHGPDRMTDVVRDMQRLYARLEAAPLVTLAEIGAPALGGGFELALACDWRIAANEARVGLPEAGLGLLAAGGGTQRLTRLLGPGLARRLILGGETLTGEQALQLGLVQWSVPRAALPAAAQALAERAAQVPRYTLAENKRCIALAASAPGEGYAAEIAATRRLYENPETRRRVTAFLDKNAAPTKEQA